MRLALSVMISLLVAAWAALGATAGGGARTIELVTGPAVLNGSDRGLFAGIMLDGDQLLVTYQIAPPDSLTRDKNLYLTIFDRDLGIVAAERQVIDVTDELFSGDLGDHKLTLMKGRVYMVALLRGTPQAGLFLYDKDFGRLRKTALIGDPDSDVFTDMGLGNDGKFLYVQAFNQPQGSNPDSWSAHVYKINRRLKAVKDELVKPESGSFTTGTAIVYVPRKQMGATSHRMQSFSTDRDFGNAQPVGIHTFAATTAKLALIAGSTRQIISEKKDVYFPTGPSWNAKHQVWVVGFTMESRKGVFPGEELGPAFIRMFDADWNLLAETQLNDGGDAMRVMTATEGDDIYVVYDEMDKAGAAKVSEAKIEHYRIAS